jgi:hypothetical protein
VTAASPTSIPYPWSCINQLEESGKWDTWSGGLGFVYKPSAYRSDDPAAIDPLIATYGDAWPAWPPAAQIIVGEAVQRASGWGAWSTAAACGLD